MNMKQCLISTLLAAVLLLAGCASTEPVGEPAEPSVYFGVGAGPAIGPALRSAKVDALRAAVIDEIGREAERAQYEHIAAVLYDVGSPDRYLDSGSMEILRRENRGSVDDPDLLVEIRVAVDRRGIRDILARNGIGSEVPADAAAESDEDAASPGGSGARGRSRSSAEEAVPEDSFVARALDTMTMLVMEDPESQVAREYLSPAVAQGNRYLLEAGYTVVDQGQMETLLRDRELVYEETTGTRASVLQWVAQRLNADVYVVVDLNTHGEIDGDDYYGNATINLTMYETSTGQLLGSVSRRSQRTYSPASLDDAVTNAVQSATYAAMERAEQQVRSGMAASFSRGIRYEVTIQRSLDSRVMRDFRSALRNDAEELVTEAQTAEETVYTIYFRGSLEELEDRIYEVAGDVAGLQDLYHVMTRGRNLVFNTGL